MSSFSTLWWLPVRQQRHFSQPQLSKHVPVLLKLLLVHQTRKFSRGAGVPFCKVSNALPIQEAPVITDHCCCIVCIFKSNLFFSIPSIYSHPTCAYDAIYVYDGYSSSSRLLGKLCGSNRATFHSTGPYLTVYFRSNNYTSYRRGFRADYRVVCKSQ